MFTRDFVARVGRMHYETRQVHGCKQRLGEIQETINALKKHRVRTETLSQIYQDRILTVPPPWFGEPIHKVAATPETRAAIAHAVGLYVEYYDALHEKKRVDAEISQSFLSQYNILREVDELRVSIAAGIAELGPLSVQLTPDGPEPRVAEILRRGHECFAESAQLTEFLGGMPSGPAPPAPPEAL